MVMLIHGVRKILLNEKEIFLSQGILLKRENPKKGLVLRPYSCSTHVNIVATLGACAFTIQFGRLCPTQLIME